MIIGTGGTTGVYYPAGMAIANIVNQKINKHRCRVHVETTGGSVFNVNAMMAGDLEFGIVQSDRQYQAWKGLKDWKERGPQKKLRSICSFHPESVVLIAGSDTGIKTLDDLKGKVVNIGNPGSGIRANATDAMQSCGIDWKRQLGIEGVRAADSARLLQEGRIDAFFYTVGHPNDSLIEATTGKKKVNFIPLSGKCIDQLIAKWPYYTSTHIPIRFYPLAQNRNDVETFGVKATFCTSVDIPERIVYIITKEIFENLEAIKNSHPAFGNLTRNTLLNALSAPIHKGALKYYIEAGLTVPRALSHPQNSE